MGRNRVRESQGGADECGSFAAAGNQRSRVAPGLALNVGHPQFAKLRMSRPVPFSFDERVWKA